MGHRHLFTSSPMFEGEHDQNWNHMQTDQTYMVTRAGSADNGPYYYPIESMFTDGINFSPHWNPLPRSNGYSSSSQNVDVPPYPSDVSGPSHDPFQQHTVSTGSFITVPENCAHHAPSSSYDRQTFQGDEASFVDLNMGSGRGHHKRKSPGIPSGCERGSTSRYYGPGSSSELPMPSDLCHEKVGLDAQPIPRDRIAMNPGYSRGNGVSIRGGESMRNVRSRSTHDLDSDMARTYFSSNLLQNAYAPNAIEQPAPMDISVQPPVGLTLEWNHFGLPPHGNVLVSDSIPFTPEPTRFLLGNNSGNEVFHQDFVQNPRNAVPQIYPGPSTQSARSVRSSYSQRQNPALRASSSNAGLRLGHPAPAEEGGLPLVAESHSRHYRPLSSVGWRNGDRSGRSRISNDRYRLLSDETSHDRFGSEGFMIVDRSAAYGSRNSLDQHREMRLDVDNMTYEELLALGERIGSVSTGVSADLMSKCMTETIYCSSDQMHDEETCAICLEEYKNMDDVGTLKSCGHDYHVECIKKWLEMKNLCPICKRPALADNLKGK